MQQERGERKLWPWLAGIAALMAVCALWFLLPVGDWINAAEDWLKRLGPWGVLLFVTVYVVAVAALAPAAPLTIAAGLVYGGWGLPIVLVAATLGASLAFLISRYLAQSRVKRAIEHRPKLKALAKAVEDEGWKTVILLRLSPLVPFNLQNYFFGITGVGFVPYAAATFAGMIPGTALYVYLGAIGKAAGSGEGSGGAVKWVFFGAGLVATGVVVWLVGRKARQKLDQAGISDKAD